MKNYTSEVPVSRSIENIEKALVRGGAQHVVRDYLNGEIMAVSFVVVQQGKKLAIRLPANAQAVYKVLEKEVRRPRQGTFDRIRDQAFRTAWKLVLDWVEIQMSLIEMEQAEFLQVFLPYVWDGERTFYAKVKEHGLSLLEDKGRKGSRV